MVSGKKILAKIVAIIAKKAKYQSTPWTSKTLFSNGYDLRLQKDIEYRMVLKMELTEPRALVGRDSPIISIGTLIMPIFVNHTDTNILNSGKVLGIVLMDMQVAATARAQATPHPDTTISVFLLNLCTMLINTRLPMVDKAPNAIDNIFSSYTLPILSKKSTA